MTGGYLDCLFRQCQKCLMAVQRRLNSCRHTRCRQACYRSLNRIDTAHSVNHSFTGSGTVRITRSPLHSAAITTAKPSTLQRITSSEYIISFTSRLPLSSVSLSTTPIHLDPVAVLPACTDSNRNSTVRPHPNNSGELRPHPPDPGMASRNNTARLPVHHQDNMALPHLSNMVRRPVHLQVSMVRLHSNSNGEHQPLHQATARLNSSMEVSNSRLLPVHPHLSKATVHHHLMLMVHPLLSSTAPLRRVSAHHPPVHQVWEVDRGFWVCPFPLHHPLSQPPMSPATMPRPTLRRSERPPRCVDHTNWNARAHTAGLRYR